MQREHTTRQEMMRLSVVFFLREPGLYSIKGSLHHTSYKDNLQRKKNYRPALVRSARLFCSPAAGGDALKPTTNPTKQLQSFEMAPGEARRRNRHAVKSLKVQAEQDGRRPSLRRCRRSPTPHTAPTPTRR